MADKEEEKVIDFEEIYNSVSELNAKYTNEGYRQAVTRHEFWFMMPAFGIPVLIKEMKRLNDNIERMFGSQKNIKEKSKEQIETDKVVRRRRRKV